MYIAIIEEIEKEGENYSNTKLSYFKSEFDSGKLRCILCLWKQLLQN